MQANIIENLPSSFETAFGTLNHWFAKLILVAKERNKKNNTSQVEKWMEEIRDLEREFHSNSPDGLISLASTLFRCEGTRDAARNLRNEWLKFQEYFQDLIRKWNDQQQLSEREVEESHQFRRAGVDKINWLARGLLDKMGQEIDPTHEDGKRCS